LSLVPCSIVSCSLVPCSSCALYLGFLVSCFLASCALCLVSCALHLVPYCSYALFKHHRHRCLLINNRFVFHAVDFSSRLAEIFQWFLFGAEHLRETWQIIFDLLNHLHPFIYNSEGVGQAHQLADCRAYHCVCSKDLFSFYFLLQWNMPREAVRDLSFVCICCGDVSRCAFTRYKDEGLIMQSRSIAQ
jgi:hypothetical protein